MAFRSRPPTRLLDVLPDLGAGLEGSALQEASDALLVATATLPIGDWQPPADSPDEGHLGYLLLSGLLVRSVSVGSGKSVELLSGGDLIRPWQEDAASFAHSRWAVLEDATVAALDQRLAMRMARWPEITSVVVEKALRRSRSLAIGAAVESITGIEQRLLALFWSLAERWGRREGEAVCIPVRLTHQTVADLVGARRPSVTTALARLADAGRLERTTEGSWLLYGDPP